MKKGFQINSTDTVAICLSDLNKGEEFYFSNNSSESANHVLALNDIPAGHKIALFDLKKGEPIVKYGFPIGHATCDIAKGEHVHSHNLSTSLNDIISYQYTPVTSKGKLPKNTKMSELTFMGYERKDKTVGVRNDIWIIPTVGCVNYVVKEIEEKCKQLSTSNIDSIVSFQHPYGCSQMDVDQENTRQILSDLIRHPNAGGVLVVGLGCENSNIDVIKQYLGDYDTDRVKFMIAQDHEDEISQAMTLMEELISYADTFQREPIPIHKLTIGLKCGGSDGFSGISANPLVGRFSDKLCSLGGTTILTEVPEMFGAETILMNRCKNKEVFEKTVDLINNFKKYFQDYDLPVYENPSYGNKLGGITTLEEKSLGCTQKSGSTTINDVLEYGDFVKENGLNLLCAPGNDLVASTALAAAGAQIVLFTTGRGTPFSSPVPTVKIASNQALSRKKKNWIDFDAGQLLDDSKNISIDSLLDLFFDYILSVANGKQVLAEEHHYQDFAIFKQGVTL